MGAEEVLAAVRNLMFKHSTIFFSPQRGTTCCMMQWSCEQEMATVVSHICELCCGTEGKEQCHHLKYPQLRCLSCPVSLGVGFSCSRRPYIMPLSCVQHMGAQCGGGRSVRSVTQARPEHRWEVGASMCVVLRIVGNKCCVLKGWLLQPAALKWMQLDVIGLCIMCLLDAANAESRNELTINKRSKIFWKN